VVPKFILRLLRGETACLHGTGSSRRRLVNARVTGHADAEANCPSYVHVRDCVTAFDKILHYGEPFQVR
ncbi:hypothetical protein T484DRAFT_1851273, partial [Baffinella frigidus]